MDSAVAYKHQAAEPPESESAEPVRILLIDDDPSFRHLCRRFLARNKTVNFELVVAHDASSGLLACESQQFDCLLIDYTLPDLSGTQAFRSIGSILTEFVPPAIILTADGGEAAAAEAVRAGAADFLSKRAVSGPSLSRAITNAITKSQLKKSMESRSRELEAANEQLQSKNAEIQRFYHTISHEVKTPLAATREFIAIVLDGIAGPTTDQQQEMLTHAIDSCDQITSHFNDLVEMTRLDANKIEMKKQLGSLENVVTRCLASIASVIEAKNITLINEIESPLPLVFIDGNRVIQVLSNLLGNAVKYTNASGTIKLSIAHDTASAHISVSVSDTGCGISDKDLPHVFKRLYQVENGGDELMGAGLGLGLSIAKEIVALHGGDIWVESKLGEGSTFGFRLPVANSIFENSESQNEDRPVN
jgi:signal transduction histidine kinase